VTGGRAGAEPFRVYVVRHARAEARGARWPDDLRRPLTPAGIVAFERLARSPRVRGLGVDCVLTSGLRRASQTARLLVSGLRKTPDLRVTRTLEPGHAPEDVLRALRRQPGRRVAVVGHEPGLSLLLAYLTGRAVRRELRKGAICCVRLPRLEAGVGRIAWAVSPKAG